MSPDDYEKQLQEKDRIIASQQEQIEALTAECVERTGLQVEASVKLAAAEEKIAAFEGREPDYQKACGSVSYSPLPR